MPTPRSFAAASLRAVLLIARWLHAADLVRATMPERGGRVFSALLRLAIRPKRPHHVWIMDFSTLSVFFGCLTVRVGAVLDSFSRKIVAISLCPGEPDAKWTCRLLQAGIRNAGVRPAHAITDKGCQFRSKSFRRHLSRRGIRHRFGAVGSPKSIGRLERLWRTLKEEWATSLLRAAPLPILTHRLRMWADFDNRERPHQGIALRTPHEIEHRRPPRRRRPVAPGDRFVLERRDLHDQPGMPIYRLRKLAS
ncbi:MAG: transposase [Planctomycetia bacterium]|nr:transposase [Planctomycetia bacterium]